MYTKLIAFTCALTAVAWGSSNVRPAQDTTSDTVATATTQDSTATASTTTDNTVEATTTGDSKGTGASQYVATKPTPRTVEASPVGADETKSADNTKTNTRDRHDTLSPLDQGNSAAETKTTANIRKGIMGDKSVSFTGKNVNVITVGTKVTLRGPVKNEQERTAIEGIAKRTAGVSEVDNQLEIAN